MVCEILADTGLNLAWVNRNGSVAFEGNWFWFQGNCHYR